MHVDRLDSTMMPVPIECMEAEAKRGFGRLRSAGGGEVHAFPCGYELFGHRFKMTRMHDNVGAVK